MTQEPMASLADIERLLQIVRDLNTKVDLINDQLTLSNEAIKELKQEVLNAKGASDA